MVERVVRSDEDMDKLRKASRNTLKLSALLSVSPWLDLEAICKASNPAQLIARQMNGDSHYQADLQIAASLGLSLGLLEGAKYGRGEKNELVEAFIERSRQTITRLEEAQRTDE